MREPRRLTTALVVGDHTAPRRAALEAAFAPAAVTFAPTLPTGPEPFDAVVLPGDAPAAVADMPGVGWVHCDKAGVEGSALTALLDRGIRVSCAAGRSAPALAEHALLFLLALAHRLPDHQHAQRRRHWGALSQDAPPARPLTGSTVTIVGVGATGTALARRCAALGMTVWGHRRRDAAADAAFARVTAVERGESLHDLLPASRFLVLAAGLNDDTHHLVGARELAALPTGAIVVNVARGGLLDEPALVAALRSGHLAGAGLDVTATEPLPPTSPLWRAPNLLLTPHTTARLPDRDERATAIIADNAGRYRRGEPLRNELGSDDVFTGVPARRAGSLAQRRATAAWRRGTGMLWRTSH